jgi:hypothetical protein
MNNMPFYRKKLSYEEIAPFVQKFLTFLRTNCSVIKELEDDGQEVFFVDKTLSLQFAQEYAKYYIPLSAANMVYVTPYDSNHLLLYFNPEKTYKAPTVSPTHVRLPKLSFLITFTPHDFFTLLRLVATAKNTQTKDSLALNPPAAGIQSIEGSPLSPFLTILRTNYRFTVEYADKKWTPRDAIELIANLPPNPYNQLMAMQYLTALQNADLMYFPTETSVELGLEWEQMNNTDYCIPENKELYS